jgi:hypothetical protein
LIPPLPLAHDCVATHTEHLLVTRNKPIHSALPHIQIPYPPLVKSSWWEP